MEEKKKELAVCVTELYNPDTKNYENILQHACNLFREIYTLPIFQSLGIEPASMKFAFNMEEQTLGDYSGSRNIVRVNLGRVLKNSGRWRVEYAFQSLYCIAHEYRHNLQKEMAYSIFKSHKNISLESYLGKDAQIIGMEYLFSHQGKGLYGARGDDASKTLLQFYPELWDEMKVKTYKFNLNEVASICDQALYFEHPIEVDARAEEEKFYKIFVSDMAKLIKDEKIIKAIHSSAWNILKVDSSTKEYYQTIAKKVNDAYSKMSVEDFQKFALDMHKLRLKESFASKKDEDSSKYTKDFDLKQKILKNAILLYHNKHLDIYDHNKRTDELDKLRLGFLKYGFSFASNIFDENYLLGRTVGEEYFQMLKNQEITSEAFVKVGMLSDKNINELLVCYINRGQTIYVEKIFQKVNKDRIKKIMYMGAKSYSNRQNRKKFDDDEVTIICNNVLDALQERIDLIEEKAKAGEVKFDDADDFINMMYSICEKFGIDLKQPFAYQDNGDYELEMKFLIRKLYQRAETIARRIAVQMAGRDLSRNEYSFLCPEDRKVYKADQKQSELRTKRIYGQVEYDFKRFEQEIIDEFNAERV